jgi:hypothetical protein
METVKRERVHTELDGKLRLPKAARAEEEEAPERIFHVPARADNVARHVRALSPLMMMMMTTEGLPF